jgi:outer membrane protein assembly factor BamD (BamD/ComL family)
MSWLRDGKRFFFAVSLLLLSACANPEGKSQQLYETAQFEEQQNNIKHARQLYEEITREYPTTSYAPKAQERLKQLEGK